MSRLRQRVAGIGLGFCFAWLLLTAAFIPLRRGPAVHAESSALAADILFWEREGETFWFTVRLANAAPASSYVITTVHKTDQPYPQHTVTVTTDAGGYATARMWSGCTYQGAFMGTVSVDVAHTGSQVATSNALTCAQFAPIMEVSATVETEDAWQSWVYVPGSGPIAFALADGNGRSHLNGSVQIVSAHGYQSPPLPLIEQRPGVYGAAWTPPAGAAALYRAQFTLNGADGSHSGLDAFIKTAGRAVWIWGEAAEGANPAVWALVTNGDEDANGRGDRDEWIEFMTAPFAEESWYASTAYLSVFPYISHTGYTEAAAFHTFLDVAHTHDLRVEALAGTHAWVNDDAGLQDGKATCDAVLDFNKSSAAAAQRFDGIHLDVEHDNWAENGRWARFIELLTYCRSQIDSYNMSYDPIILSADIPPHFGTGAHRTGEVMSGWDVMMLVDTVVLMDYRDFADVRKDGRTDGIIPRADPFLIDGNALQTPVIIGVELLLNPYDHVTFYEECLFHMELELEKVSTRLATSWAFQGIAMHDYEHWRTQRKSCLFLPLIESK